MGPDLVWGFFENVGELWQAGEFCDFKISIADRHFKCHRFHLCACSAFFKNLLQSESKENSGSHVSHVTIKGISPDTIALVLKAVYKGENGLDTSSVIEVWHAAHELEIGVLISKCEEFVMDNLTLENYQNIFQSAILLGSARVLQSVLQFMAENFEVFRHTRTFLELPVSFVLDIAGNDRLMVESRDHLVHAILHWVGHVSRDDGEYKTNGEREDEGAEVTKLSAEDPHSGKMKINGQKSRSNILADNSSQDGKDVVEVIFPVTPLSLSEDSRRKLLRQALGKQPAREGSLAKLLKLAKLGDASTECLRTVYKNDLVMKVGEAKQIVGRALMTRAKSPNSEKKAEDCGPILEKTVASDGELSSAAECMVFCQSTDQGSTLILAYDLVTDKIYELDVVQHRIELITSNNEDVQIPLSVVHGNEEKEVFYRLSFLNGEMVKTTESLPDGAHTPVYVDNFLYCFQDDKVFRKGPMECENKSWIHVGTMPDSLETVNLATVFNDKIILIHEKSYSTSELSVYTSQKMSCFNTSTRRFHSMGIDFNISPIPAFFVYNEHLYILDWDGMIWKLVEHPDYSFSVERVMIRFDQRKSSFWKLAKSLWGVPDFHLNLWGSEICRVIGGLCGATVYDEQLFVFVNQPFYSNHLQTESAPFGFKSVKFVYLPATKKTNCCLVKVPKNVLKRER